MTVRGDAVLSGGLFDGRELTVQVGLDGEPTQFSRRISVTDDGRTDWYRYVGMEDSFALYLCIDTQGEEPLFHGLYRSEMIRPVSEDS